MRIRATAIAATITTAAIAVTLTACGTGDEQGTAERATSSAPSATTEKKADEPKNDDKPNTELAVGDGFRYKDGLKITVTAISRITKYGEYDEKPAANQTAFRVSWTVTNGSSKPVDLDGWGYNATGATTGGQTMPIAVEPGSKFMTGRLAAGREASFTSEYTIAKNDGPDILFTMTRLDESTNLLAEDPHWTGTIK
ncbi:hypothetical protein [Streptomyces sp. bgisy153]|uniref:hypothetical protein n=1 Tax=Streptomyces sp. bgisy153 TaxID=3413793 RepID=UPI003D710D12